MSTALHPTIAPITTKPLSVPGFLAAATRAGLKKDCKLDLALLYAPQGAQVAAVFTQSQVVAAPVIVSRRHAADHSASALIINAGNANAMTGAAGMQTAIATCQATASTLGIAPDDVLVASTGVIGVELPLERITDNLGSLIETLGATPAALEDVAQAIMTTDLVAKTFSTTVTVGTDIYTITGIAKGSGMMAPNMATVIGCVLTDAPLAPEAMDTLWKGAIEVSFNCMTVDGDTSTNDTAVLLSSGIGLGKIPIAVGSPAYEALREAITGICIELARSIARDGEGATKLIDIVVTGAPNDTAAKTVALTIGNSPLVKTALFGNDANWGRIAAAAGRSGVAFDQSILHITIAGIEVCTQGTAVPFNEDEALYALDQPEVTLTVDLGAGSGTAHVWTCDFSYDYVKINGEYRS